MSEGTLLSGFRRSEASRDWPDLKAFASTILYKSVVLAVAATWIAFWGLVIRLHLLQGAFVSAVVVGLLFVIPAIVGLSAYLGPLPDSKRLVPT